MSDIAIKVENISKKYALGSIGAGTLRETLANGWERLRGSNGHGENGEAKEFWALKDINFEVKQGEVVGIIGKNGAGKSTLLKVLSRITEPTTGQIKLNGRIASLLEVGTGFHPELTGRENIFLNGSILGMTRAEIRKKFDEIVDFSGVEKFLDTPVKRYSSGMYVRLAFAVAAHLEPEILVIDEVLAVGDAEFQKKCLGKMKDVAGQGRTVLFVSHNMAAVRNLCSRACCMFDGTMNSFDSVELAVDFYFNQDSAAERLVGKILWNLEEAPGGSEVKLTSIELQDAQNKTRGFFSSNEDIYISFSYHVSQDLRGFRLYLQVWDLEDQVVFSATSQHYESHKKLAGFYTATALIPANLLNGGTYKVYLHAGSPGKKKYVHGHPFIKFHIDKVSPITGSAEMEGYPGSIAPLINWQIQKLK